MGGQAVTHTYAVLEVSRETYDEVYLLLTNAGYQHAFVTDDRPPVIDMQGIALHSKAQTKDGPLLQCIDCKNTESPAGAMARQFNHGRCMHCGGYFKVVRA